jgi:hypothetical protein
MATKESGRPGRSLHAALREYREGGRRRRLAKARRDTAHIAGLVRSVMRPLPKLSARRAGAANAAFRWITPDLATPVQAVTRSGVDAIRDGTGLERSISISLRRSPGDRPRQGP